MGWIGPGRLRSRSPRAGATSPGAGAGGPGAPRSLPGRAAVQRSIMAWEFQAPRPTSRAVQRSSPCRSSMGRAASASGAKTDAGRPCGTSRRHCRRRARGDERCRASRPRTRARPGRRPAGRRRGWRPRSRGSGAVRRPGPAAAVRLARRKHLGHRRLRQGAILQPGTARGLLDQGWPRASSPPRAA